MSYQIDRYNGTVFTTVPDQTVDSTSSDIKLIGKNYAGYGEITNENFLHILENFRGTTAPRRPITGQLWFDETNNRIKYRDATSNWRALTVTEVDAIPPTSLLARDAGTFWYDSDKNQLNVWSGTEFVVVGPQQSPGFGNTRLISGTIRDNGNTEYPIIKVFVDGVVIGTIADDEFDIGVIDSITGFTRIKKGFTLINTGSNGITSSAHRYWGTASNSERLGGLEPTSYIRRNPVGSTFGDEGFTVGEGDNPSAPYPGDLRLWVEGGNNPVIENQSGTDLTIRIKDNTEILDYIFNPEGFLPGDNLTQDIGSSASRWKTIWADVINAGSIQGTFLGTFQGNLTGNSTGTHKGEIRATDNSVAYNPLTKVFTGNLTGNVTGNISGDLVGNTEGDHTGDLFAIDGRIAFNHATKTFGDPVDGGYTYLGNASTSNKFLTPVRINGVLFDGSENIEVNDPQAVLKSGSSMTGYLTLVGAPVNPNHAATKQYVEDYTQTFYTSKPLVFSLDTKGLTVNGIATLLNTLAPVINYQPGQLARIAGSEYSSASVTVNYSVGGWISVSFVTSISGGTATINNPTRNNDLIFQVNSLGTSWEYVSG